MTRDRRDPRRLGGAVTVGTGAVPPHDAARSCDRDRMVLAVRIGVVVVLVAAPGGLGVDPWLGPAYRTAAVGTGTVVATLDSVGTITPVNQANLNFNVSGTVSAVDVSRRPDRHLRPDPGVAEHRRLSTPP